MPHRRITVQTDSGLHARPASLIAQTVKASGFAITAAVDDGQPTDACSILALMSLGARQGDEITFACDDAASDETLDALAQIIADMDDEHV